jgi:SOS response regulatory protein OraA/RecX
LDDTRTAQNFVHLSRGKRAKSHSLLREELLDLGAPEAAVNEALSMARPDADAIMDLLASRHPKPAERAKSGRFLYTRGFSEEQIESALDAYFGSAE